jgi:hypothetical protein
MDVDGNRFKLQIKIDGETIEKYIPKSNDHAEVHPSCLGIELY